MKKVYLFVLLILISVTANVLFYSPNIVDLVTGEKLSNIVLQWPVWRLFIEPFYALSYYIMGMDSGSYWFAGISWLLWIILFAFLFAKSKKENLKNTAIYCAFFVFFFVSVVCMVISLPIIGGKITNVEGYKVVDVHSHTIESRDSISTVMSSIAYHNMQGFTDFFITDHDNTKSYNNIPADIGTEHIFPGVQIKTREGQTLILLSQYKFRYEDFRDMSTKELIKFAHSEGMLVIAPYWWEYNFTEPEQLVKWGIDGFEIYNYRHLNVSKEYRQRLIELCKTNKLLMFGSTDWHGMGYMTNVWTLVERTSNTNIFNLLSKKPETKIVVHKTKNSTSFIRYIFEPFYFLLSYSVDTPLKYVMSFYMFFLIIAALTYKLPALKIIRIISLYMSFVLCIYTFYFVKMLTYSFFNNVVIPEEILPISISLVFIWLIIWGFCDKEN